MGGLTVGKRRIAWQTEYLVVDALGYRQMTTFSKTLIARLQVWRNGIMNIGLDAGIEKVGSYLVATGTKYRKEMVNAI